MSVQTDMRRVVLRKYGTLHVHIRFVEYQADMHMLHFSPECLFGWNPMHFPIFTCICYAL